MKYDDLKPRQQDWIQKFYHGLQNEAQELKHTFRIDDAYTRSYIRYMSSKYCDMEWGPAWIVKDKSRSAPGPNGGGVYMIPELQEYGDTTPHPVIFLHGWCLRRFANEWSAHEDEQEWESRVPR